MQATGKEVDTILQSVNPAPAPENLPAVGFMSIIEKAASLDNVDVDKLERMMAMQLQWEDRQAERHYNDSMTEVMKDLAPIKITKSKKVEYEVEKGKPEKGKYEAFRYVPLEQIEPIIRPILLNHGFFISYDTEPCAIPGWHTIVVWIAHTGGHRKPYRIPMPLETGGGKNNAQAMGSTQMYGMRRALCAALNIIPIGEDNEATGAPITDDQAKEIKDGLIETGLDTVKFLATLKAESVEEIRTKDYRRAMTAINAKRWEIQQQKAGAK
jgi:hypothetical protein